MSEINEISLQCCRVLVFLEKSGGWRTNKEIAAGAAVALRTAENHTKNLVEAGVLDIAELHPARRYRISAKADKRNGAYYRRLQAAIEIFGLRDPPRLAPQRIMRAEERKGGQTIG